MGNEIKGMFRQTPTFEPKLTTSKTKPADIKTDANVNKDLSEVMKKAVKSLTAKPKSWVDLIKSGLENGLEYGKSVRDQANADKKEGVKPFEGANNFWNKVVAQAEDLGQRGQDQILNTFKDETVNVIKDQLSGTKVGNYLDDIFGIGKGVASAGGSSAAMATAAAEGTAVKGALATEGAITSAAGKAAAAEGSSLLGSASGIASKALGAVGAAYSLYSLFNDFGKSSPVVSAMHGATVGAYVGTMVGGPVGTVVGGAVGLVGGAVLGLFSKGKHPERIARDDMRSGLQNIGFLDKNNSVKLADGSSYSFASEGKEDLASLDGTTRTGYQIDFNNPLSSQAIGWLEPLANAITGGNQKLRTDLVGYMTNAVTSNAKSSEELKANVMAIYEQAQIPLEDLVNLNAELFKQGLIDENRFEAYMNGIDTLVSDRKPILNSQAEINMLPPEALAA